MQFYEDKKRNILLYPQFTPYLQQALPDARQVNGRYLGVPNTLANLQVLRHFQYPVPPVITDSTYDFPIKPGRKPLATQRLMANFSVLHRRMFNLSDPGCVDCETEYLSPSGWRRIDRYEGGPVAQYHPEGHISFVEPLAYVVRPCQEMFRFWTQRGVDQKLSAEHRVAYLDWSDRLQIAPAHEIAKIHDKQIQGWRGRFINTFSYAGKGIPLSEDALRLMVAVIADGHFPNRTTRCVINVKKDRKKQRLRRLLNAAGIAYKEKKLDYATKQGYTLFSFFAPRREKEFGDDYWNADAKQLKIIAEESMYWDGSAPQGRRGPTFSSVNKRSADFIQFAYAATGRTARISPQPHNKLVHGLWVVTTRTKGVLLGLSQHKKVTVEPTTDGKKYCFEVPTNLLVLRRNGQIFITGNTMKTLSSLWAADFLMRRHAPGTFRALIIGTLSTLETGWAAEIFNNFLDRRSFEILHGSAQKRLAGLAKPRDFYIVNHDGVGVGAHTRKRLELDGFSKELANRKDIQLVIVDEASAYKDAQTKRHRLGRLIFADRPYLWPLTGSPTPTAPTDAYGIAKLVNNAMGKSFTGFQAETMYKVTQFKWVPQKDGYDKAARLLTPSIRISIDQVWDGPEMVTEQREVDLTEQQKKLMADLKRDLQVTLKAGQPISAVNEAAARQKFLQISLGAVYDENHKVHFVDAAPRLGELDRVIAETTRKIVIFVGLTSVVELLYKHLHKRWHSGIINGNVSQKERARIIREFGGDGGPRIVICDPQATAHGINEFVSADTVVWFGTTEKAELYDQGNKRVRRPGQKYPTRCVQLVSNPLEKEIFRRLENHLTLQGSLLSLIQEGKI